MPYRSPNSSADSWLRLPTAAARSPATARSLVNAPAMPPVARMPQPIVSAIAPPLESTRSRMLSITGNGPAAGPAGGGPRERGRLVGQSPMRDGEDDADVRDVVLPRPVQRCAVRERRPPLLGDRGAGVVRPARQVSVAAGCRSAVAARGALVPPGAQRVRA